MKPRIIHDVPATREAIGKAFGIQVGELFIPNPTIQEYAAVVRFAGDKVVVSGEVQRALKKLSGICGTRLFMARDFTVEARQILHTAQCDMITKTEFGWTDAAYNQARQR